jgi:hypothetical protein
MSSGMLHHLDSYKNRRFGVTYRLQHQGDTISSQSSSVVTANVVSSSPILTLMMEEIRSPETSILTRTTRRDFTEDGILHVNLYRSFS